MISVEMIGYFSDAPHSQKFPVGALRYFYPDVGNFIAVIGQVTDRHIVRDVKDLMRYFGMETYSFNAPRSLGSINFSDHASYWDYDFPAAMVTDTSFLRNPHYHKSTDTIDTLNFGKMRETVYSLYNVVLSY